MCLRVILMSSGKCKHNHDSSHTNSFNYCFLIKIRTDLDFVKGPIMNPDDPGLGIGKDSTSSHESKPDFSSESHFPVHSFNTHFGNIFGNNFFTSFPGLGFFDFPRYEPWWKG